MSRVEELPNRFDENMSLSNDPRSSSDLPFPLRSDSPRNTIEPSLPPHMQSVRSYNASEIVDMMNKTPLFMTSLEDTKNGDDENVELEAIRALQYEGTPAENAQGFKVQGNEQVKIRRWKDAKEFYTKGLAVLAKKLGAPNTLAIEGETLASNSAPDSEDEKVRAVEEACYVNRALCNLELKNYRATTLDCAAAIRLNPTNVKAYYRSSQALLALDKTTEALDSCTRGLTIDPSNSSMRALVAKIEMRASTLAADQQRKNEQTERAQREKAMLSAALRGRGIRMRATAQPPDMEDAFIHLAPDALSPTSILHFPVILLYPLHAQSDFIKAVPETDTVLQHLEYILPLPWDEKGEYQTSTVGLYMVTSDGSLLKIGRKTTLLEILGRENVVVVDQMVRINVVPKGRANAWIEGMRTRKGKPSS